MLKIGTLRDLFTSASERVLSCLNLPTSSVDVVPTPGLRSVVITVIDQVAHPLNAENSLLTAGHGCRLVGLLVFAMRTPPVIS
jgi:hypothetical protein